jgi:hypothetical protein
LFYSIRNPEKSCFIDQDRWCLTELLPIPTAVELSQWIGIGGRGWPISSSASWKIVGCLQSRNNALSLASTADATMNLRIAHNVKNAPFNLMGCMGLDFYPTKKCPHALLWAFASDWYDAFE